MSMPVAHFTTFPERPRRVARLGSDRKRKQTTLCDRFDADQPMSTPCRTCTGRLSGPPIGPQTCARPRPPQDPKASLYPIATAACGAA